MNHLFGVAELFLHFCVGDIARRQIVLHLKCLLKSERSLDVVFGFIINQADIMQARSARLKALGDLEAFDRILVGTLLGIQNTQSVIGGRIFFINSQDSQKRFLCPKIFVVS